MARTNSAGESLDFSTGVKEEIFRLNQANAPRGCVGYWCEWCYFSNVQRHYFDVDHIIPASRVEELGIPVTELTSVSNGCVLCKPCNQSKSKYDSPRHGVGLAFRAPNLNLTHGEKRQPHLSWEEMIEMASRKGIFKRS